MTNETFVPMGLVELTKQLTDSARANINTKRKQVDDLEGRLHSALDAVYDDIDCHPDYDAKTDSIAEKEVEVRNDPMTDLISNVNKNMQLWNKAIADSYQQGYDDGYKAGRDAEMKQSSEQRDRDLLESHGIDIDELVESVQETIKAHEQRDRDIDEDEPDQYQPETEKWGGTK
jgi:hypothetical protein